MGARKWCQDMRFRNVKTRENGTQQWNTTMEQHRGLVELRMALAPLSPRADHICVCSPSPWGIYNILGQHVARDSYPSYLDGQGTSDHRRRIVGRI
jgi:hypothetical protein